MGLTGAQTSRQTCADGVWPLITGLANSSYQHLGPSAVCTESLSQLNQHSVKATPSLRSGIYYLRLCLRLCEGGVKEQRRVSKGFTELKVAGGFSNLSFFVVIRKQAIKLYPNSFRFNYYSGNVSLFGGFKNCPRALIGPFGNHAFPTTADCQMAANLEEDFPTIFGLDVAKYGKWWQNLRCNVLQ